MLILVADLWMLGGESPDSWNEFAPGAVHASAHGLLLGESPERNPPPI